ncbi:MAG: nitrilase-related carbon-nitrogen hydrolase [Chloroherpetonaceae bacterium]|nr:nitrilase-related carbon-nitrogen hydrolase [Chloroherpetonaceae bacterium]
MKTKIRVCQTDCTLANFQENLERHLVLIEQAIAEGIEFIVFPELSLSGYNVQDAAQDIALPISDEKFDPLRKASHQISILCGGIELSEHYGVYNSAFFFEDGKSETVHRKIYLPTYGMFEELRYFSAGKQVQPFHSKRLGKIGVAICEDNWHVSVPYLLAAQGIKVLFMMVASPLRIDMRSGELRIAETWQMMARTYATLFSMFTVFANRIGNEDGLSYWGGSEVISPDGETLAKAPNFQSTHIDAFIDFAMVKRARLRSSHFLDEDFSFCRDELNRIIDQKTHLG